MDEPKTTKEKQVRLVEEPVQVEPTAINLGEKQSCVGEGGSKSSSESVTNELPTVAMGIFRFYGWRGVWFLLDLLMVGILTGLTLSECRAFWRGGIPLVPHESEILGVLICAAIFALKYFRGLNDYAEIGLFVVDKDGAPITPKRSLLRALAYSFTWFLFPVHFILIAAGNRRLLHDYLAGTHVVSASEDLSKSFYPPVQKWVAPLLVFCCIALACNSSLLSSKLAELEENIVPICLGSDSANYLFYLKLRFLRPADDLAFSRSSPSLVDKYGAMSDIERKISGPDSEESIRMLYKAALVSARARDRVATKKHVYELLAISPGQLRVALQDEEYRNSWAHLGPTYVAAVLFEEAGCYDLAADLAEKEKASAILSRDQKVYQTCCRILYKRYSALSESTKGPESKKWEALARKERLDRQKRLGLYLYEE